MILFKRKPTTTRIVSSSLEFFTSSSTGLIEIDKIFISNNTFKLQNWFRRNYTNFLPQVLTRFCTPIGARRLSVLVKSCCCRSALPPIACSNWRLAVSLERTGYCVVVVGAVGRGDAVKALQTFAWKEKDREYIVTSFQILLYQLWSHLNYWKVISIISRGWSSVCLSEWVISVITVNRKNTKLCRDAIVFYV